MKRFLLFQCLVLFAYRLGAEPLVDTDHGLSADIPRGWTLYGKAKAQDPNRFIYDYGMPKIWSERENQEIENAVAVILDQPCDSLAELVAIQEKWTGNRLVSRENLKTDLSDRAKREIITEKGLAYTTRIDLLLRKRTGYIIIFTATAGTYQQNLGRYLDFLKSFKAEGTPNKLVQPVP